MAKTTITAQLYKHGKTHQWLADRLEVTVGCIAQWMRGHRPQSYATMRKCADLLLCEPSDIWPEIRLPINWEHRYRVVTERLLGLDYKSDKAEYQQLCSERAAASVHIYIATQRRRRDEGGYDEYLLPTYN